MRKRGRASGDNRGLSEWTDQDILAALVILSIAISAFVAQALIR